MEYLLIFFSFLQTKLCRVKLYQWKGIKEYDPFIEDSEMKKEMLLNLLKSNVKDIEQKSLLVKRKLEVDENQINEELNETPVKKIKLNEKKEEVIKIIGDDVRNTSAIYYENSSLSSSVSNFHRNSYEITNDVFSFKTFVAQKYAIEPQFYREKLDGNMELCVWLLPYMKKESDCRNMRNILKHQTGHWIISKRVRWLVATLKRSV